MNIEYIHGRFENPKYNGKAEKIISSLVLHQIKQQNKEKALSNVKNLLSKNGRFILCDTLMFFDSENDSKTFNDVYRYLLPKTTPSKIYDKYIRKYMENDLDYIYTWEDMKKYTPPENRYYSKIELEGLLRKLNMKIVKEKIFTPFFGIVMIEKNDT